MVSVCLPSDALSQPLLSYLGFSYLGREVSLYGCSSKVQLLLLTLDEGYLLMAAPPNQQEYWIGLPFPSPVDHILSDLFIMTRPSWVALQAWLGFTELDKAVVLV